MKYAFFAGCKIPYYVPQYEIATRMIFSALDIGLKDVEFNCCGYPVRNLDFYSYLYSAARNLALAEKTAAGLVTPCKCCYGSFRHAAYILSERKDLKERINTQLAPLELQYTGELKIRHILQVLYHDAGIDAIKANVRNPLDGSRAAVHYGCHALRPSRITDFDNPDNPTMFDRLVEATGVVSVQWPMRLDCCGNPLWQKNDRLSRFLAAKKINSALDAGAEYICVSCTYCQIQFDQLQQAMLEAADIETPLPSILYPQLLGLAMGFSYKRLGMDTHYLDAQSVAAPRKKKEDDRSVAETA